MTIPEFIEKAIEGDSTGKAGYWYHDASTHEMLLDPLAWQAVGKVENWPMYRCQCGEYFNKIGMIQCPNCKHFGARHSYHENMVQMIHALIEGKTIEEFISTL